ncbi:hypothetical protein ASG43_05505 [Aureimonas sp. Leaf454]|uniref:hypothetical protein n=1 Tax=Aureimonas sp. Leaf454 TaxID=1736381 RepID=UPI0006FA4481|nr:hypothetical protein [Aureimonas sp. Leaf454]KQT50735.1 hypothetical protein ASG43_05505 [Aureimonas sp. Leaf454]
MLKTMLFAATAFASVAAAHAEDLAPLAGRTIELADASGTIYYTKEAAGFRVVATLSGSEGAAPVRFVTTLDDGQAMTVSVPVEGQDAREIEITRTGEVLVVAPVEPLMVRASLD